MKTQHGWTLVELVIFILIIGIIATGIMSTFRTVLSLSNNPATVLKATQLANARMMIILQRRINTSDSGFTLFADPCESAPPAACTGLATFATSNGFTVNSSFPTGSPVRTATISVLQGSNVLTTVTMRFVQ